jgi:hypothetical protein
MEIVTIISLGKELDSYALGAKLLDRVCSRQQPDLAWLESEDPKALGQLVLICHDFMMPKIKKELVAEDVSQIEKALLIASTVLARRAVEGK